MTRRSNLPLQDVDLTTLKPVPDFPGYYANADGQIFILREKQPKFDRYALISYTNRGKTVWSSVHRMVCAAFHGRPSEGQEAAHNNGDAWDNRASNLRWATRAENTEDKKAHGTWGSRFSEDDIREMKRLLADGVPGVEVARRFRTYSGFVSELKTGKRWAHVKPGPR